MRCPYCTTEVAEEALVCPQCRRDLYLVKPLLEKIARLEQAAAEHAATADSGARIAALERELAEVRAQQSEAGAARSPAVERSPVPGRTPRQALAQALLSTLVLLVAAHGVLLFVYDVKPLYLRLATMVIPVPFGLLLALHHPGRLLRWSVAGFGMAVVAVLSMLVVTATIDKVPVLPQDAREMRETLEYVASIGLAFLTGLVAGEFAPALREKGSPPNRVMRLVARAITPDDEGTLGLEKVAKKIDKWVKAATPVATGAASVYAGIKALLGDPG